MLRPIIDRLLYQGVTGVNMCSTGVAGVIIRCTWTEKVPKCFSLSCEVLRLSQNRRVLTEPKTMLGRPLSL